MLNKLNPKQIKLMDEVRDEWLDRFFSCKVKTDRKQATKYINWLYKFCGLEKPLIIFLDSPLGAQYGANMIGGSQVRSQVRSQVWGQVEDQVEDQVMDQVWSQVRDQVMGQVENQVMDQVISQVMSQVKNQVMDQVMGQVEDQVEDQVRLDKLQVYDFAYYGSVWDYGWVSFYDYFRKIGKVKLSAFNNFVFLLKAGIYDMIQLDKVCIVSDMPSKIHRDERNRLHNLSGPAIEWRDGYYLYFANGVAVPEKIILHPEKLTKKDWMNQSNLEVRRVIQEQMGSQFVEKIGGKLLHKGIRGKLYEVDLQDDPEKVARYVKVKDSSTKREYYLRVPPTINDADAGIAWTFGLEVDQYSPVQEA